MKTVKEKILDLLADGKKLSSNEIAIALGKKRQTIGPILSALVDAEVYYDGDIGKYSLNRNYSKAEKESFFCTSCRMTRPTVGAKRIISGNGVARVKCSACVLLCKTKGKPGRKPAPREDYDLTDPVDDREYIRQVMGV